MSAITVDPRPRNPLRDPRDRRLPRVPEPCALVVFGVTGDLSRKKLLPAVYDLANRGLLPTDFVLLGFARRDWDDGDFEKLAKTAAKEHARTDWNEEVWERLVGNIMFVPGLLRRRRRLRHARPDTRRPAATRTASRATRRSTCRSRRACSRPCSSRWSAPGWPTTRSPAAGAGSSSRSRSGTTWPARASSTSWSTTCSPRSDVFRIDHYLGKETVQNLMALRFANQLFEPVWNANYVDSVQITMAEDVGIGGRAAFYDATGAARDVLQNHLLQLLALTAMEEPVEFTAEAIRTEKLKVLRAITLPADLGALRGPRPVRPGLAGRRAGRWRYPAEKDVPADSTTETYAAVRLGIETRRWAGVPFYLRTGKRLPRRVTEIAVLFKKAPHLPFSHDRHRGARPQPARHPGAARRGRHAEVRLEGARHRRWRSATSRWTSSTARRSPSPPPRPTSG